MLGLTSHLPLVFCLPFSILNCLKLRRRQKIGLVGVFSLGMITMIISLSRFIAYTVTDYNIDDASGSKLPILSIPRPIKHASGSTSNLNLDAWCTAEMCTAIIVVSLPTLKSLIVPSTPTNTVNRSTNGYLQTGSARLSNTRGMNRSHVYGGEMEEEMELTFLDRKPSSSPTTTTAGTGTRDAKDFVMVRTDVTVTREGV